jgi:hypothetical protein
MYKYIIFYADGSKSRESYDEEKLIKSYQDSIKKQEILYDILNKFKKDKKSKNIYKFDLNQLNGTKRNQKVELEFVRIMYELKYQGFKSRKISSNEYRQSLTNNKKALERLKGARLVKMRMVEEEVTNDLYKYVKVLEQIDDHI